MIVVTVVLFVVAAAIGATARHLAARTLNGPFPYGTLVVNLTSSLALGALSGRDGVWSTVVGIGLLGALSTWSTVANEVAELARERQGLLAGLYLWATATSGVVAAWIGLQLA